METARKRRRDVNTEALHGLIQEMPQPSLEWVPPEGGAKPLPLLFAKDAPYFHDEDECLVYLWHKGVFYTENVKCSKDGCGRDMQLYVSGGRTRWRCGRRRCGGETTLRKNTPFYHKGQKLHKLLLVYRMLVANDRAMRIAQDTGLALRTIREIKADFNELILCDLATVPSKLKITLEDDNDLFKFLHRSEDRRSRHRRRD